MTVETRDADLTAPAAELRRGTYTDFLYGIGQPPLDLGRPTRYRKRANHVFEHRYERGTTVVNTGDEPVDVALDDCYAGTDGIRRTWVSLPPRSAEVLKAVRT
jgi:hypothetical protein